MVVRVYGQGRSQDTQTLEFSLSELGLGSQPALFTIMYVGHELSGPPKVGVAIQGLLCFHTNCEVFCSGSVKNAIGSLIGIALNL